MIDKIKDELRGNIGRTAMIKYNLGRNKFEKYQVKIKEIYNYVFLVETQNEENPEIKSFSYSDVITKTIKIDFN